MTHASWGLVAALAIAACGPSSVAKTTSAPSPVVAAAPVSDPEEYRDHGISAAAGERYFGVLGGGDPYATGIAYPVWLALLESYPALGGSVPGFADRFGFLPDPSQHDVPLGFHLTVDPNTHVAFVMMNCQLCHAERLRLPDGDHVVSGLGSTRVRAHAYDAALMHVARDASFTTESLLDAATNAAREHDATWPDAARLPIVRATVIALRERADARGADAERLGANGLPGRLATVESFAMAMNARGAHVPLGPVTGWSKIPDVRGFPWRDTLSWDGVGTGSPVALAAEADFAFGARPEWFESHRHIATSLYLFLKHFDRKLPYPGSIDAGRADRGRSVFDATCAKCHGSYAPDGPLPRVRYREKVVPVDVVGTDPARESAVTPAFVDAANGVALARGVTTVAATGGYVPPVLLDVWARGTFGHVGQWPSIEVMARRPEDRPKRFVVDLDAPYDVEHMGLRWTDAAGAPAAHGYVYDGTTPGYSPSGHRFLCDLPPDDRRAVIEYLKTL
jgi:mono/diheme cytochrome c family protein